MTSPTPALYTGRFAPSPTGPLHFGSLISALASFLDARAHRGQWLVRIEDLDPPREQPGAVDAIIQCLTAHHLQWDGELLFQSQRLASYAAIVEELLNKKLAYHCYCSRQDIQAMGGIYNGNCRIFESNPHLAPNQPSAIRLKVSDLPNALSRYFSSQQLSTLIQFDDLLQGRQTQHLDTDTGDFIIRRKDHLFAYQLAVVVDDIKQHITHVIRGCDLLDSTARQIFLFKLLGAPSPQFGHIPVIVDQRGNKLSKQTGALALKNSNAGANLWQAMQCLNLSPPAKLYHAPPAELLQWGTLNWSRSKLPLGFTINCPISMSPPSST